jgi:aminotransferase
MPTTRLAQRAALKDARVNTRLQDIADGLTDVIRMGRGDPDLDTPAHIVAAGRRRWRRRHALHPPAGHPAAARGHRRHPQGAWRRQLHADEIVVTPGAQQAIFTVALGLLDPATRWSSPARLQPVPPGGRTGRRQGGRPSARRWPPTSR